jgi:hypothetical protein
MVQRSGTYGAASAGSQGKYWWIREREDEDVLTAARRAGLYGSALKQEEERARSDAGFLERSFETGVDAVGNIISGAAKSLEGVFDLGLGAIGAVGGIFDKGVRDEMRRWVEYDFTGENISKHFDRWSDDSIMNDSRAGRIAEGVFSGVGQLLPTVAISVATGGAALPAMLATGAGAAGNATEEAFNDGADYYRGLGYGVVSGGVEMATEKLFGGLGGLMGGGMLDNVTRSVAKTGAARVIKEAAGEAAEEALAEVVNPLAKSIYKGRDALSDYGSADYWGGVGEAALVGSLTSAAYGGTVGRAIKTSGKYADVQAVKDEIEAINKKRSNLYINDKLTDAQEDALQKSEVTNYRVLERILQRSSDKKRADLIKRGNLSRAFDESGTLRTDFLRSLGERVMDGQTDTPGTNEAQGAKSAAVDRRYVSPSLYYKTDVIERDLEAIGSKTGTVAKVFEGNLSTAAQGNYKKLKRALAALNRAGGNDVSLVITEANDKYNGGLVNGRTIYLGADRLSGADYAKTLVHEFTHFEEGTKEYSKMLDFLSSDKVTVDDGKGGYTVLHDRAETAVAAKGYDIDLEGIRKALDKEKAGEAITAEEAEAIRLYVSEVTAHESELLLGNEAFIDRIVREDGGFAEKIVSRVLSLDKAFAKLGDKEAKAQHKLVREAERLYLKAAEAAGNGRIARMILSQTPELEEEVKLSRQDGEEAKKKQFDIIQATNPMWDDFHVGIRSSDDIRTWEEVLDLNDESEGQFVWGDFSREDAERALKENSITIYSSYPIKNGTFVSTSYVQAREYAGGRPNSKVYSKTVPLNEVAWINGDEGQYAAESIDVRLSLKDGANQQTSDDIGELIRSAGIEGDAVEIREDLAELYRKAENLAMDEDATSGKAFVERVANRIALNMARAGKARDGEGREAMAERLREEILSRSAFAEQETEADKEATKETPKDEPKPKKTGYTYDDVHGMMDAVKKGLTFEMMSGKVVEGKIYRNDPWEVNKKIYHTL